MKNYLAEQQKRIKKNIWRNISDVYSHRQFILGPEVIEIETRLSEYVGVKHCITCASGTDALLMAAMVLFSPGEHVCVPDFTYVATAESVRRSGAIIDPVQPNHKSWSTNNTVSVDLFGCPSVGFFNKLGDCAQSFGAKINGQSTLSRYQIACTSFFPTKPLGCHGDGGACFTDDDDIAKQLSILRQHGTYDNKYYSVKLGLNSRLDTIQAAVLLAKLEIFDDELGRRQYVAEKYTSALSGSNYTLQKIPDICTSSWALYCVLAKNEHHRATVLRELRSRGYDCGVYYPFPIHQQPAFAGVHIERGLVSDDLSKRVFALPFHPYMDDVDIQQVSEILWKNN